MNKAKRLLVAGSLTASVIAGATLLSAKPATADDWDHPVRRVVRVLQDDGRYVTRSYYYDYNGHHYVPYSQWRRSYDDWYYSHDRHWRRHHDYRGDRDDD